MCNEAVRIEPLSLAYDPQEIYNEVVRNKLRILLFGLDHLWTQEMSNEIMRTIPNAFYRIPDLFKTQEMFIKAVEVDPSFLLVVPDHFKAQGICDKAVIDDSSSLQYVPNWFVTREGVDMWYDNSEYCDDDKNNFFKCYDGYKKRKAQKTSIKEELLPIAWYPSRYLDWCMSEEEKKETEKLWA